MSKLKSNYTWIACYVGITHAFIVFTIITVAIFSKQLRIPLRHTPPKPNECCHCSGKLG